jgi:hypothetical protein
MRSNKRADLIDSVCGGAGRQFNGSSCLYYAQAPAKQCRLLKARRMKAFWKQCRGAYLLFYNLVQIWHKRFKARYSGLPIDEAEDFDFEGVIRRLQKQTIHVENLAGWWKYVSKTVYLEVKKRLIRRGLLPEKRNCGSCKHLSLVKPYVCAKTGKSRKKTDLPCEEYRSKIVRFTSIDGESSPGIEDSRQRLDRLLLEMLTVNNQKRNTPETLVIEKEEHERSALSIIIVMLTQRPDNEKPGSKKSKKYERHYAVFTNIVHLLAQGIPKEEAIKCLAKRFSVNEKTIRRDIAEIKEFLREKEVLEWLP